MCENIPQDFDRVIFVEVLYWHVFDPLAQHIQELFRCKTRLHLQTLRNCMDNLFIFSVSRSSNNFCAFVLSFA